MSAHLPLMLLSEARSHQGQAHRCHCWSIHLSLKEPQAGREDPKAVCVCVEGGRTCEQGWHGVPNTRLSWKSVKRTTVDAAPTAGPHPLSPSTGDGKD